MSEAKKRIAWHKKQKQYHTDEIKKYTASYKQMEEYPQKINDDKKAHAKKSLNSINNEWDPVMYNQEPFTKDELNVLSALSQEMDKGTTGAEFDEIYEQFTEIIMRKIL